MTSSPSSPARTAGVGGGRPGPRHVRTFHVDEWLARPVHRGVYRLYRLAVAGGRRTRSTIGQPPCSRPGCRSSSWAAQFDMPARRWSTCLGIWPSWADTAASSSRQRRPMWWGRATTDCASTESSRRRRSPARSTASTRRGAAAVPRARSGPSGSSHRPSPACRHWCRPEAPLHRRRCSRPPPPLWPRPVRTRSPGSRGSAVAPDAPRVARGPLSPHGRAGTRLTLAGDQLVPGVAVSGTVDVGPATVTAVLTVAGTGLPPATALGLVARRLGLAATATVTGISVAWRGRHLPRPYRGDRRDPASPCRPGQPS